MSSTINSTSNQNSINQATANTTSKGTPIVNQSTQNALDKNSFLKILSAELANEDPDSQQDGTQYVAQMAQFSELEQMANLNTTMMLVGANSLMGKQVTLDKTDANGNTYSGQVQSVVQNAGNIAINVAVGTTKDSNGNTVPNIQQFGMDDITNIQNANSTTASTSNVTNTGSAQTSPNTSS
jgi:flagellar basal-body rod modification protein FlgD